MEFRATLRFLCQVAMLMACVAIVTSKPHTRQIECETEELSSVCYVCAQLHREQLHLVYEKCCLGDLQVRSYCESVYWVPARRGGMWVNPFD